MVFRFYTSGNVAARKILGIERTKSIITVTKFSEQSYLSFSINVQPVMNQQSPCIYCFNFDEFSWTLNNLITHSVYNKRCLLFITIGYFALIFNLFINYLAYHSQRYITGSCNFCLSVSDYISWRVASLSFVILQSSMKNFHYIESQWNCSLSITSHQSNRRG